MSGVVPIVTQQTYKNIDFFSSAFISEKTYKLCSIKFIIKNLGSYATSTEADKKLLIRTEREVKKKPQVSFNGGCSTLVVRATVAREKRVRFPPFALNTSVRDDNI